MKSVPLCTLAPQYSNILSLKLRRLPAMYSQGVTIRHRSITIVILIQL